MYECSLERLNDKIETFSRFGATPGGGVTRYALSPEDGQAREEFVRRMEAIGATIEVDDVANLYATLAGSDPEAKRIVIGSHSDSVKQGGNYDGILGVIAGMEVLETVVDLGIEHRHPLTAMIWTNEEGSLYPPALMASGIVCYDHLPEAIRGKYAPEDMLASPSRLDATQTFGAALAGSAYQGDRRHRLNPERDRAFFELHIEQGPVLEDAGLPVGVVDCVLGMFNYRLRFYGQTVHAGTFPMHKRQDALFGAAQAICQLHEQIDALGHPELVYTTGEIVCHPGIHTCVPDYVDFSIDVRHESAELRERVGAIVRGCAEREWAGCPCEVEKMWSRDTVYFDEQLVGHLEAAAKEGEIRYRRMPSGAGHDAQFASYMLPSAMIFVQSKDGLSHCEPEFSAHEHCQQAITVLLGAVLRLDRA